MTSSGDIPIIERMVNKSRVTVMIVQFNHNKTKHNVARWMYHVSAVLIYRRINFLNAPRCNFESI